MTTETSLLLLLSVLLYLMLIILRSLIISTGNETQFEITRQSKNGEETAQKTNNRLSSLSDILTTKHILETVFIILFVICITQALGFIIGVCVAIILLLILETVARVPMIGSFSLKQYEKYELQLLPYIRKVHPVLYRIRKTTDQRPKDFTLHSREELLYLVDQAQSIFTPDERQRLHHTLSFDNKTVGDIMTPRSVTETIKASETLGPIVLDRLHKTGHSRFPVIEENMDHIIGMLYAHDLVKHIRASKAQSVREVMDKKLFYINEHQSLSSALAGFLRTKHHLFIVVDEFKETTGVITIEDVIEALIGHKIVDEFDQYDDLRAVAKRAAKTRNKSAHSTHITDKKTGDTDDTNTNS
jgi:CBS domain containing-hemolysin-like protein